MSKEAIQTARNAFARVAAEIAEARAADKPEAVADAKKALADVRTAEADDKADSNMRAAPANMAQTVEKMVEDTRQQLVDAATVVERLASDSAAVRAAVAELKAKQEAAERRADKFRFNTDGSVSIRGEFTKDDHQRLIETPTKDPALRHMQTMHDALVFMGAAHSRAADKFRHTGDLDLFPFKDGNGRRLTDFNQLPMLQKYRGQVRAMYSTGAAVGDEFVPTMVSAQVYEHYEAERLVSSFFERIQMPSNPFTIPAEITDPTFYIGGEATSDPGASAKASNMGTAGRTLTAVKLIALTRISNELQEDSVVAITPLLQKRLGIGWATTEEDAIINGDTSATHQDTGLSLASNDHRRAWTGLRKAVNTAQKVDLGTYTDAAFSGLLKTMGAFAVGRGANQPLVVASVGAFLKYIQTSGNFFSVEKLASTMLAANMAGVDGRYLNCRVVVSDKLRDDMNASGVYDGSTTTKGALVIVAPQAWIIGEKKGMDIRMVEDIEADQLVMVARVREVLKKLEADAATSEALGYNIA